MNKKNKITRLLSVGIVLVFSLLLMVCGTGSYSSLNSDYTFRIEKRAGKIGLGESSLGSNNVTTITSSCAEALIKPYFGTKTSLSSFDNHNNSGNNSLVDATTNSLSVFSYSFFLWNNTSASIDFSYGLAISSQLSRIQNFKSNCFLLLFCNDNSGPNHEYISYDGNPYSKDFALWGKYSQLKNETVLFLTICFCFITEPPISIQSKDIHFSLWVFN